MLTYSLEDNNSSSALIEEANYKQTRISTLVIEAIDIVIEDETTGWPNVIY